MKRRPTYRFPTEFVIETAIKGSSATETDICHNIGVAEDRFAQTVKEAQEKTATDGVVRYVSMYLSLKVATTTAGDK